MKFSNDYLDLWDNPASLTTEEIAFFKETVDCVKTALEVDVEITNRDHYREMAGKSKEAHGIIYAIDPKNPAEDCFITVDNFFIHECFMEKFHGELNLSFESLEHVICHEIAHMSKWRHGKGHTRLTEELFEKVQSFQKEKKQEVTRDSGENGMEKTERSIEKIYEGDDGVIYNVAVASERFVDVKVCPDGLVYVMENGDGSMVFGPGGADADTYPEFTFDEMEVVRLVKEVHQKEFGRQSLEDQIKAADFVKQGQVKNCDDMLCDNIR